MSLVACARVASRPHSGIDEEDGKPAWRWPPDSGSGEYAQPRAAGPAPARERDCRGGASARLRQPRCEPHAAGRGRTFRCGRRGSRTARGFAGRGPCGGGENDALRLACAAPTARCQRRGAARASALWLWRCHGHRLRSRLRDIGHGRAGGAPQTHPRRQPQEQRRHRLPRLMQRTTRTVGLHDTMSDIGWWSVKACRKSAFKSAI